MERDNPPPPGHEGRFVQPLSYLRPRAPSHPKAVATPPEKAIDREERQGLVSFFLSLLSSFPLRSWRLWVFFYIFNRTPLLPPAVQTPATEQVEEKAKEKKNERKTKNKDCLGRPSEIKLLI